MGKRIFLYKRGYLPGIFRHTGKGRLFNKIIFTVAFTSFCQLGFSQTEERRPVELQETLKRYPTINEFLINSVYEAKVASSENKAIYRFTDTIAQEPVYVAWSKSGVQQSLKLPKGSYWVMDTAQVAVNKPLEYNKIQITEAPVFILQAASQSPIIRFVMVDGKPVEPFASDGDLWLSTWADDNNIYSGWGDGKGPLYDAGENSWVDCGVVKLTGDLPDLTPQTRYREDPAPPLPINDKPSSLLYLDSCLYGQFHSPLGDARIGYLAQSWDYGTTWKRIGFFKEGENPPADASPWLREKRSPFRCMFFINMGKNYQLNSDGYVYALAIGSEWHWMGLRVFLTRVKKENIANYDRYEYFAGYSKHKSPLWTANQAKARPVKGPITFGQGSVIYHPGIKRYVFMTDFDVFDAPHPWGPWTYAGTWTNWKTRPGIKEWQGGYQPGIITKGTGEDFYWFTISGQNKKPNITYSYNLGKMVLKLKQ